MTSTTKKLKIFGWLRVMQSRKCIANGPCVFPSGALVARWQGLIKLITKATALYLAERALYTPRLQQTRCF